MKTVLLVIAIVLSGNGNAQGIKEKLAAAINTLEKDPQFKHAAVSIYVKADGDLVYEKNAELGMAPASTQKVITSVSAFEMLGKDYRYKTIFDAGSRQPGKYDLFISGSGDPTLGSWRYETTKEEAVLKNIYQYLAQKKIKTLGTITVNHLPLESTPLPGGWPWEDVGNYYGAGHFNLNWRENQYDLLFNSTAPATATKITGTKPSRLNYKFRNTVTAGAAGSGDNAYIYFMPGTDTLLVEGTIPPDKNGFTISGAMYNPATIFLQEINNYLADKRHLVPVAGTAINDQQGNLKPYQMNGDYEYYSPPLDSINYWFLKRSINLYGEALVKTIAAEKTKEAGTDAGLAFIRNFWNTKGIDRAALNMTDGSGLSPANRITTKALVQVLEYASGSKWFPSFYNALPEMNDIKMKDGYIGGVRAYAGYIKSRTGEKYTFAFIVNNFDGSPGTVREKMYKVLDLLK